MNELIPIAESEIGDATVKSVSARDLHAFLQVGKDFSSWIKSRIEQYGFVEGVDFASFESGPLNGGAGNRGNRIEYEISIDMAKELSMVERNQKGKDARQYFIECERRAKISAVPAVNLDDPTFLRTALLQYTEKVIVLQKTITEQAPAVEFAKAVRNTEDSISIGDMARLLGLGQNRLFRRLRDDHILMASNRPYQQYLDRDYFRVIENVWFDAEKEPHPTFKTVVTGRGQVYLQRKYGAEAA